MHDFLMISRAAFRHSYMQEPLPDQVQEKLAICDEDMFRMACRHRMAGLWFAAGCAPRLQDYVYGQSVACARCDVEVERIFAALENVVPSAGLLKGPVLARQAWPQPAMRHYDDLDLRIEKQALPAMSELLASLGYQPVAADLNRHSHLWHYGWGVTFINSMGFRIECNHRFFPTHFPTSAVFVKPGESAWTHIQVGQQAVSTLDAAAHLLYCCLHVIWHGWERASWAIDIAGLLVRHPGILDSARKLAGKKGFSRSALEAVSSACSAWLGPFPHNDEYRLYDRVQVEQLDALLMRADHENRKKEILHIWRDHSNVLEWMKSKLLRGIIPGDPDFCFISLPPGRRQLYWIVRPFRKLMYHGR
jgi:hypothetical protein